MLQSPSEAKTRRCAAGLAQLRATWAEAAGAAVAAAALSADSEGWVASSPSEFFWHLFWISRSFCDFDRVCDCYAPATHSQTIIALGVDGGCLALLLLGSRQALVVGWGGLAFWARGCCGWVGAWAGRLPSASGGMHSSLNMHLIQTHKQPCCIRSQVVAPLQQCSTFAVRHTPWRTS